MSKSLTTTPFSEARLRALLAERRRRAPPPSRSLFDPAPLSFNGPGGVGAQRGFLLDPAQFRCVCTSRRSGKSTGFGLDIFGEADRAPPDSTLVYLNTTRERAQRTLWEYLKATARAHGLPWVANESRLSLRGPGNRWIFVSGGESKKHVAKWKGTLPAVWAAYVDEAQDWDPDVLQHALWSVLVPTLIDRGGRLTVAGTPGPMPDQDDVWYALTQNAEFSQHFWTLWDNPHLKGARALLDKTMRARRVDENDPTIQREFFGQWVADTESLVFGCLSDTENLYDELPDGEDWQHVAGADFGTVDDSALQVLTFNALLSSKLFGSLTRAWNGVGPIGTMDRINQELEPFKTGLSGAVGDPAGGGSGIMLDLNDKHGFEFEAAPKLADYKVAAVKLLADVIRARDLVFNAKDPEVRKLLRDLRRVQWNPNHRGTKLKGHMPDRVDALLYGFRKAWPMFRTGQPPQEPSEEEAFLARVRAREAERAAGDA